MEPPDDVWTFDFYTAQLGAAAATLDQMLADGEVTAVDIWGLVERFPTARQPAAYSLLSGLRSRTALQKYAMQIEAEREEREQMARQAKAQQDRVDAKERELRTFWVGLFLLLLPLAISISIPSLNENAVRSVRICSAAGLGLLIAYIPGFFTLDSSVDTKAIKVAFRTAGAMAGLVMVYFFDPGTMSELLRSVFGKR